jgi:hypothetical protein
MTALKFRVLKSVDEIVDQCCEAGTLAETKSKSKSCPSRAAIGQSPRLAWQASITRVASEHEVLRAGLRPDNNVTIL